MLGCNVDCYDSQSKIALMLNDLSHLESEDLQNLLIIENRKFKNGLSNLSFDDLKAIRATVRHIILELEKRNIAYHHLLDM